MKYGSLRKVTRQVIFPAVVCLLFSPDVLSAHPREGDIIWYPAGANYVQGPWAVQWQGSVYLGGHAGKCCYAPIPHGPGWEVPYVIAYGPDQVTATENAIVLPPDTHEFAWGSMVRYNGDWLYAGIRTQWSTYPGDNRIRLMLAMTPNPMTAPYQYAWWDLTPGDWNAMSSLVWIGDRLILFHGVQRWQIAIGETGPYRAPAMVRLQDGPVLPWSDIAWSDGKLYALVSGDDSCWWSNCFEITEYESDDEGVTWSKGNRYWGVGGLPGGVLPFIGDAAYIRDELGHIDRSALVVIGLVTPNPDPTSSTWYFHWWADSGAELPATFGMPPGTRKARKHINGIWDHQKESGWNCFRGNR